MEVDHPKGRAFAFSRGRRGCAVLAALLAGGTVFDACTVRVHDAVINGTKDFIASLLDPANVLGDALDSTQP